MMAQTRSHEPESNAMANGQMAFVKRKNYPFTEPTDNGRTGMTGLSQPVIFGIGIVFTLLAVMLAIFLGE